MQHQNAAAAASVEAEVVDATQVVLVGGGAHTFGFDSWRTAAVEGRLAAAVGAG